MHGNNHDSDELDEEYGEEDVDIDAPRVAQWMDDEKLDDVQETESSEDESQDEVDDLGEGPSHQINMKSLQNDLSSLPFGALRKAQHALAQAKVVSESDDESEDESGPEEQVTQLSAMGKEKEKEKEKEREKREVAKRKHKHAPMEVTSKKPVPRKKPDFEEKKLVPRDPRFLPMTGEFSTQQFQRQYRFLSELHVNEMKTLKENLKRARKLLASSPRDLREEREQEVQRLERALKRAESMVNKDRREKIEEEALSKVTVEEREKRKQGKGAWFMKTSDKKELLARAKYDALAASGGKGAVKKAIEKKQKKVAQKEKKKRPFAPPSGGGDSGWAGKRSRSGAQAERPNKRPKFG